MTGPKNKRLNWETCQLKSQHSRKEKDDIGGRFLILKLMDDIALGSGDKSRQTDMNRGPSGMTGGMNY